MTKGQERDVYREIAEEQKALFLASDDCAKLRSKWVRKKWGLRHGCRTAEELQKIHEQWSKPSSESRNGSAADNSFWDFQRECGAAGDKYGMAPWVVEHLLFLGRYEADYSRVSSISALAARWYIAAGESTPVDMVEAARTAQRLGARLRTGYQEYPDGVDDTHPFWAVVEYPLDVPVAHCIALVRHALQTTRRYYQHFGLSINLRARKGPVPLWELHVVSSPDADGVALLEDLARARDLRVRPAGFRTSLASTGIHKRYPYHVLQVAVHFSPKCQANELARNVRSAFQAARSLSRDAGLLKIRRVRAAPTLRKARELRLFQPKLEPNKAYDIVDEVYGEDDLTADQARRKRVGDQRHKGRRHLKGRLPS